MTKVFSNMALALARAKAQIDQQELSKRSGVSRPQISRLESGKMKARPITVIKLANALGVEPESLYEEQ
jgi:transcriptional regulator with XRE-family HTH domain